MIARATLTAPGFASPFPSVSNRPADGSGPTAATINSNPGFVFNKTATVVGGGALVDGSTIAYTLAIRNEGTEPVRLLTRHWIITDANGRVQDVRGDGVVGEQPHLKPGQGFRYASGAVLETPVGVMQGSYQMVTDGGERFDAPIAPFSLAMPGVVH